MTATLDIKARAVQAARNYLLCARVAPARIDELISEMEPVIDVVIWQIWLNLEWADAEHGHVITDDSPREDVTAKASELDAMCWDIDSPVSVRAAANRARHLLLAGRTEDAEDVARDRAVSTSRPEEIAGLRRVSDIVTGGAK